MLFRILVFCVLCMFSPDGSVDDFHDALIDTLTHVDQWRSSFSHTTQQQTYNRTRVTGSEPDCGILVPGGLCVVKYTDSESININIECLK